MAIPYEKNPVKKSGTAFTLYCQRLSKKLNLVQRLLTNAYIIFCRLQCQIIFVFLLKMSFLCGIIILCFEFIQGNLKKTGAGYE